MRDFSELDRSWESLFGKTPSPNADIVGEMKALGLLYDFSFRRGTRERSFFATTRRASSLRLRGNWIRALFSSGVYRPGLVIFGLFGYILVWAAYPKRHIVKNAIKS